MSHVSRHSGAQATTETISWPAIAVIESLAPASSRFHSAWTTALLSASSSAVLDTRYQSRCV
jgi:hypothetical protein